MPDITLKDHISYHGPDMWTNAPEVVCILLTTLGEAVALLRTDHLRYEDANPAQRDFDYLGTQYSNDIFSMRPYCTCDGSKPGHEDECPPNFEYGQIQARWYKRAGRITQVNHSLTTEHWTEIFSQCINSLSKESRETSTS